MTDEVTQLEQAGVMTVVKNDDGSTTITLLRPFEHAKEPVTSVRLRDCFAKDLRAMDQTSGEIGKRLRLISELAGISMACVDKLHASDLAVITDVIESYLEKPRGTGGTS